MRNSIRNPLKLTFHQGKQQYVVNKPLDQSGEYVSKEIAESLVRALDEVLMLFNKESAFVSEEEHKVAEANAIKALNDAL
jgi:hypothetical protein